MNKLLAALFAALIFSACSRNTENVAGGVETGNGVVMGVVYSSAGAPVENSRVTIVKNDYHPVNDSLEESMIDTTDSLGVFSVELTPGKYTLYAQSDTELTLVQSIRMVESDDIKLDVELTKPKHVEIALAAQALTDGVLYFEGTPVAVPYSAGDSYVELDLPQNGTLPPMVQYENGSETVLAEKLNVLDSKKIKGTDGFGDFITLVFDTARLQMWAGSKYNGLFSYALDGTTVQHFNEQEYPGFLYQVKEIGFDHNLNPFVGTNSGAYSYNSQSSSFEPVALDPVMNGRVLAMEIFSDSTRAILYESGIETEDTVIELTGVRAGCFKDSVLYVGNSDGRIFTYNFDDNSFDISSFVLPLIQTMEVMKDGSLMVLTDGGVSIISNGVEIDRYDEFAKDSSYTTVKRVIQDSFGTIWALLDKGKVISRDNEGEITHYTGYEHLFPQTAVQGVLAWPVDIQFDQDDNLWLLGTDGSLIKLLL